MGFPRKPEELTRAWVLRALGRDGADDGPFSWERIGIDVGLAATLVRVRIGADGDEPETVIVKWADVRNGGPEIAFLEKVAPGVPRLPVARILHGEVDAAADAAVLVLEDVAPARATDCLTGITPGEAARIYDAITELHAAWWGRTAEPAAAGFLLWTRTPERDIERVRPAAPVAIERYPHLIPAGLRPFVLDLPQQIRRSLDALSGNPLTLVHDDLHCENVLFRPDGSPVIHDWSDVRRGPAAIDFARILVEGLLPDTRRAHAHALAAHYVAALRRAGVREYDEARLLRDTAHAHVFLLAAAIRWAGLSEDPREETPRVAAIVENLVRNACDAVLTGIAR